MTDRTQQGGLAWQPTASDLESFLDGRLVETSSDLGPFDGLGVLAEAGSNEISFVVDEKALQDAAGSAAALLLVPTGPVSDALAGRARLEVEAIWPAVVRLIERLYPEPTPPPGVHETARVEEGVDLAPDVSVGAFSIVGRGASIGEGSVVGPHCVVDGRARIGRHSTLSTGVVVQGEVEIGDRCLVFPGAVLGADGFRFEVVDGAPLKIPQVGRIVIEDDVEIGANTTIDRAFLSETRIGRGTKIDNQVQIAHNVIIGPSCFIAAQVGIAGSTRIGTGCMIGGHAGFKDNIEIGPQTMIGGMTGIHKSFPEGGESLWGFPATPLKRYGRIQAVLNRLPELDRRVKALERARRSES